VVEVMESGCWWVVGDGLSEVLARCGAAAAVGAAGLWGSCGEGWWLV